jgi:hypothetical protein
MDRLTHGDGGVLKACLRTGFIFWWMHFTSQPVQKCATESDGISRYSSQDRLVCFEIFSDSFDAVAGVGDAKGIRLAQFVMHQQLAHKAYDQIRFRHTPKLTSFEGWWVNGAVQFDFYHVKTCTFSGN